MIIERLFFCPTLVPIIKRQTQKKYFLMAEATETKSSKTNLRWFLALLITLLIFAVISPAIVGAFQNLKKPSGT